MKSKLMLRMSLILWLIIFVLAMIEPAWFVGKLPDALREYLATRPRLHVSPSNYPLIAIGFTFLIGAPICAIGLLFLKHWARLGLTVTYLLNIIGVAFLEPSIRTGINSAIGELSVVAISFALGIAWYSDALPERGAVDAS